MMNLARIKRRHEKILGDLRRKYCGRRVSLQTGKYKGREAMITDVMICWNGEARFCTPPFRARGSGMLDDQQAVQYRRRDEFKIIYGEGR